MSAPLLQKVPALRILIFVCTGIVTGTTLVPGFYPKLILIFVLLIAGLAGLYKKSNLTAFIAFSLVIGLILATRISETYRQTEFRQQPRIDALFSGEILQVISKDNSYFRCVAGGNLLAKNLPEIKYTRIILSLNNCDSLIKSLEPGVMIFADCKVRKPGRAILPTDFREDSYCSSLEVSWIAKAYPKDLAITGKSFNIFYYRNIIVGGIKERIHKYVTGSNAGILLALTTGDKSELSPETRETFSLTGTAHILAVSGFHVGIFSFFIFSLLGFVKNRWLKLIIFSILLVCFMILTGMHTSTLRAGGMAFAVMLAHSLERKVNLTNVLSFVVLIILLISPSLIFSAGFQMSAGAILGISLLYNPLQLFINKIFKSENRAVQYIVSSFSLTIAASVIVSPLVAYYYGIFSVISPITNLIVIPLMSLGMIFGWIFIIITYISPLLASIYAVTSDYFINLSCLINNIAIKLPYSFIKNEFAVLISIIMSSMIIYIVNSKKTGTVYFRTGISLAIICQIFFIANINPKSQPIIIPRTDYLSVVLPLRHDSTLVLFIDRKPHQLPIYDLGMANYLTKMNDSLIIGINGNAGMSVNDVIKKQRNVKLFYLSNDALRLIGKKLRKGPLPQIID